MVPSRFTAKTSSNTVAAARKKNPNSKDHRPGNAAKIEAVDLSNERDRYAEYRPTEFRRLSQLHESVTQGLSTPLIPRTRPTSDFKGWDQSKISFLNKAAATEHSNDQPSTEYNSLRMGGLPADSNWMGGLPLDGNQVSGLAIDSNWTGDLPSAPLLSTPQDRNHGLPQHDRSTDYGSDWQSDLPSLSALLGEDIPMDETPYNNDSLQDFDPSGSDKDEVDLEDAMVGFSDSVAITHDPQVEAVNTSMNLQGDNQFQSLYERPTQGMVASEKPCASVESVFPRDSPDGSIESTRKRKEFSASDEDEETLSAPVEKKAKTSNESEQALQPSSNAENKAEIKPGQPAWVYKFDPAFIAEYQDFVEFV